jgi:hypothetical protein
MNINKPIIMIKMAIIMMLELGIEDQVGLLVIIKLKEQRG